MSLTPKTEADLLVIKAMNLIGPGGLFRQFMCQSQRRAVRQILLGEERAWMADLIVKLAERIEGMPVTYEQDKKGKNATAFLHYFRGGWDWWITEKDMSATPEAPEHHQAFGWASDSGVEYGEFGYISLPEILAGDVELDLHFDPKTVKELTK